MPNYATAYDVTMCEPPDNSLAEARFESALESNLKEFIAGGHLPRMLDSGDVDMELADHWPEALHEITQAYDRGDKVALLALAVKIAEKREEIARDIIIDAMKESENA